MGPSLALWRAAEIAALREQIYEPPVLDLGCGDGLVTSMVLSNVEFGLDPDENSLNRAATRRIYERFLALPAERAPLRTGTIETVISNSVLEHLERIREVLCAVSRILRRGGRFIFTVPTELFSSSLALPSERYGAWRNRQLIHVNMWTLDRWCERLWDAGLHLEEARPYLRPSLVRWWDLMELAQMVWVGRYRLAGMLWKSLPDSTLARLARRASRIDLSSGAPGAGQLIVAVKQ